MPGAERCKDAGHQTSVDPEPTMSLPSKARYVVIGAGIHGLPRPSTWRSELEEKGRAAARTSSSSTRRQVGAGAPASPAAWSATTTSSPPCAS